MQRSRALALFSAGVILTFCLAAQSPNPDCTAGLQKFKDKDYAGALAEFDKVIASNPTDAEAYNDRAMVNEHLRNYSRALADLNRAIELKPSSALYLGNRASVKWMINDGRGALADAERATVLDGRMGALRVLSGLAHRAYGDADSAARDFAKAIDLNPKKAGGYGGLGELANDRHDWDEALKNFHMALKFNPYFNEAIFRIWTIRARLGQERQATEEMRHSIMPTHDAQTDRWMASIAAYLAGELPAPDFVLQNDATARDTMERKQHQCAANYYIGIKHLIAGDKAGAAEYFRKAVGSGQITQAAFSTARAELKALK